MGTTSFVDVIKNILSNAAGPMTPQEIRAVIKKDFPEFYATTSHVKNVNKGHYKDLDHALLAQIYVQVGSNKAFFCDKRAKPMRILLNTNDETQILRRDIVASRGLNSANAQSDGAYYNNKVQNILENADAFHLAYYKSEVFQGPSLYFHLRALETRQMPMSVKHLARLCSFES